MAASWYYALNGEQVGPVESELLKQMVSKGSLRADTMIWREGMPDWVTVASLPKLAAFLPKAAASHDDDFGFALAPEPVVSQQQEYRHSQGYAQQPAATGRPTLGYQSNRPASGSPPPNHLTGAILVTIFCCWPLGIPAIVAAAKVNSLHLSGDRSGALAASENANAWIQRSIWTWAILFVISITLNIVIAIAGR